MPEEITLKKQALALRATLATLTDAQAIKATLAELAQVEMRQSMAEHARRAFLQG